MARRFTAGSSEKIVLSLGALGFAFGPGTIAVIARATTLSAVRSLIFGGGVANTGYGLVLQTSGVLSLNCNGSTASSATAVSTTKWYLLAATKATGTVAPRLHIYDYLTRLWKHETSGGTLANSTAAGTSAKLGSNFDATTFHDGDLAIAGVWNVVLNDGQVESLATNPSPSNWTAEAQPKGLWIPDPSPSVTVTDLTGNGASESSHTGTTSTPDEFPLLLPTRYRRPGASG